MTLNLTSGLVGYGHILFIVVEYEGAHVKNRTILFENKNFFLNLQKQDSNVIFYIAVGRTTILTFLV